MAPFIHISTQIYNTQAKNYHSLTYRGYFYATTALLLLLLLLFRKQHQELYTYTQKPERTTTLFDLDGKLLNMMMNKSKKKSIFCCIMLPTFQLLVTLAMPSCVDRRWLDAGARIYVSYKMNAVFRCSREGRTLFFVFVFICLKKREQTLNNQRSNKTLHKNEWFEGGWLLFFAADNVRQCVRFFQTFTR